MEGSEATAVRIEHLEERVGDHDDRIRVLERIDPDGTMRQRVETLWEKYLQKSGVAIVANAIGAALGAAAAVIGAMAAAGFFR